MGHEPDAGAEQMLERITNVLTALNGYRAKHLEDSRIESIMTQLENTETLIQEGGWYKDSELRALDFHLVEDTPMEGNENLKRELQSIRNYVEHKL